MASDDGQTVVVATVTEDDVLLTTSWQKQLFAVSKEYRALRMEIARGWEDAGPGSALRRGSEVPAGSACHRRQRAQPHVAENAGLRAVGKNNASTGCSNRFCASVGLRSRPKVSRYWMRSWGA